MTSFEKLKGVAKTSIASGAIALTLAGGLAMIPTSADAWRGGGFRGGYGGFRGGFGRGYGFRGGYGRGFGFRGGFGPRFGLGFGYGYPYYGGYYGCGPYRRFYGGCGYGGYPYYY